MPTTMTWPLSVGPVGDVAIANQALSLLGANYLVSTTSLPSSEGTPEANFINQFYAPIRRVVLEDRDWTFATLKVLLDTPVDPLDVGAPTIPPTWGYGFLIPDDSIRVVKLFTAGTGLSLPGTSDDPEAGENKVIFEKLGNYVFCNESSVWMKYIWDQDDPTTFSPNFVFAFAARLAMELCLPLTNNVQLFQAMGAKYQLAMKDAASGDGRQGTSQKLKPPSRLRMSRYGRR